MNLDIYYWFDGRHLEILTLPYHGQYPRAWLADGDVDGRRQRWWAVVWVAAGRYLSGSGERVATAVPGCGLVMASIGCDDGGWPEQHWWRGWWAGRWAGGHIGYG